MTYTTFLRSATSFEELSNAPKETVETRLTFEEAQEACRTFNENRTEAEIEAGTRMEFTADFL